MITSPILPWSRAISTCVGQLFDHRSGANLSPRIPEVVASCPMADDQKICGTCNSGYDPTNAEAVKRHTELVNCGSCTRCRRKPRCYMCFGSFCFCTDH